MQTLISIGLSLIISLLGMAGAYKYMPIKFLETQPKQEFGASITTINGTDTLSSSRAVINTNFSNLNSSKIENSTTSVASITTLPNLATASNLVTVGTLTSGALGTGFTAVPVSLGGTGTTTPTSNMVMIGNGTSGFKVIGFGSSGQFLTSQGAGTVPAWTTAAIDQAANYTWTGAHAFTTTSATTSIERLSVGAIGSSTATANATTTIWGNVNITGRVVSGVRQTCMGSVNLSSTGQTAVNCGFQPTMINFQARDNTGEYQGWSNGYSNGTQNYAMGTTRDTNHYATSTALYSFFVVLSNGFNGGSRLIGTSTMTATGFSINALFVGVTGATVNYSAW